MAYDYEKLYAREENALGAPSAAFTAFFEAQRGASLSVLDLGCGQGRDAIFITQAGHKVTAIDFAPSGIAQLDQHAKQNALAIRAIAADIRTYQPDQHHDVIIYDRVLHMLTPDEAIAALHLQVPYLNPEGHLLIADEKRNLPAFQSATDEIADWQNVNEKGGLLFRSRLP